MGRKRGHYQPSKASGIKRGRQQGEGKRGTWDKELEDSRDVKFVLRSPLFEAYYQAQGIMPPQEWSAFVTTLREPLPATFRIQQDCSYIEKLREELAEHSAHIVTIDGRDIKPVAPLPWYPGGVAYQVGCDRRAIRKSPELAAFHRWMVDHTESGAITRQEAVSMVPPLFLDVRPGHVVLDTCAAPGSKTAQIMEALSAGGDASGLVVANEVDRDRAYMLVHQCRRVITPCLCVTWCAAQHFPQLGRQPSRAEVRAAKVAAAAAAAEGAVAVAARTEKGDAGIADKVGLAATAAAAAAAAAGSGVFDRVLADVPCTGDGTLRKQPGIWRSWGAGGAIGLHPMQLAIALRGAALLRVGGLLVYSTCSFNPIENEAVVAALLASGGGSLELVDSAAEVSGLQRRPGLRTWKVLDDRAWNRAQATAAAKKRTEASAAQRAAGRGPGGRYGGGGCGGGRERGRDGLGRSDRSGGGGDGEDATEDATEEAASAAAAAATGMDAEVGEGDGAAAAANAAVVNGGVTDGAAAGAAAAGVATRADAEAAATATPSAPSAAAPNADGMGLTPSADPLRWAEEVGFRNYPKYEDVPPWSRRRLRPTMFPPAVADAAALKLERCMRFLPHDQDTGGFFVAVLRKVGPFSLAQARDAAEAGVPTEADILRVVGFASGRNADGEKRNGGGGGGRGKGGDIGVESAAANGGAMAVEEAAAYHGAVAAGGAAAEGKAVAASEVGGDAAAAAASAMDIDGLPEAAINGSMVAPEDDGGNDGPDGADADGSAADGASDFADVAADRGEGDDRRGGGRGSGRGGLNGRGGGGGGNGGGERERSPPGARRPELGRLRPGDNREREEYLLLDSARVADLKSSLGLSDAFPFESLYTRCSNARAVTWAPPAARRLILDGDVARRLQVVHVGLKAFEEHTKRADPEADDAVAAGGGAADVAADAAAGSGDAVDGAAVAEANAGGGDAAGPSGGTAAGATNGGGGGEAKVYHGVLYRVFQEALPAVEPFMLRRRVTCTAADFARALRGGVLKFEELSARAVADLIPVDPGFVALVFDPAASAAAADGGRIGGGGGGKIVLAGWRGRANTVNVMANKNHLHALRATLESVVGSSAAADAATDGAADSGPLVAATTMNGATDTANAGSS